MILEFIREVTFGEDGGSSDYKGIMGDFWDVAILFPYLGNVLIL